MIKAGYSIQACFPSSRVQYFASRHPGQVSFAMDQINAFLFPTKEMAVKYMYEMDLKDDERNLKVRPIYSEEKAALWS